MRFLMLYRPADAAPRPVLEALVQEMARSGVLLATDGFCAPSPALRVRIRGGEYEVSDEPVAAEPALPSGYAVVQVSTWERAVELAKRFLAVAGDGAGEISLLPT
jgi:hypothetical protein